MLAAKACGVSVAQIYSALMPRIAITPPSKLVSAFTRLASPSGDEPTVCQPCWNSLPRTSSLRAISLISAASLAWSGLGRVEGAAKAFQISRLKLLMPAST